MRVPGAFSIGIARPHGQKPRDDGPIHLLVIGKRDHGTVRGALGLSLVHPPTRFSTLGEVREMIKEKAGGRLAELSGELEEVFAIMGKTENAARDTFFAEKECDGAK